MFADIQYAQTNATDRMHNPAAHMRTCRVIVSVMYNDNIFINISIFMIAITFVAKFKRANDVTIVTAA